MGGAAPRCNCRGLTSRNRRLDLFQARPVHRSWYVGSKLRLADEAIRLSMFPWADGRWRRRGERPADINTRARRGEHRSLAARAELIPAGWQGEEEHITADPLVGSRVPGHWLRKFRGVQINSAASFPSCRERRATLSGPCEIASSHLMLPHLRQPRQAAPRTHQTRRQPAF